VDRSPPTPPTRSRRRPPPAAPAYASKTTVRPQLEHPSPAGCYELFVSLADRGAHSAKFSLK
jgi:hypothetical protein